MKKNIIFAAFAAASALLLVSSCAKEQLRENINTGDGKVFSAAISQELTKTTITSEYKVNWDQGDQINIGEAIYSATPDASDATKATFTKVSGPDPTPEYTAVYPASIMVETQATLPATHTYAAGKFNAPMCAISETESLEFKNFCGVLCFALKGTDKVKSIAVTANEQLCGPFEFADATNFSFTEENKGYTVTLDCGEGVQLSATDSTNFYISLPPATYTAGMKIVITNTEGKTIEKITTKSATIARNQIYTFNWTAPAPLPTGALKGEFSVSADKKVHFSQGNLWYGKVGDAQTATLHFEDAQWKSTPASVGSKDHNHVSHFTWSDNVPDAVGDSYSGSNLFCDENNKQSVDGSDPIYYALSQEEWDYLFCYGHYSKIRENKCRWATVNGVGGYVIAPDDFTGTLQESYADDAALAAAGDLVFLPAAGFRDVDEFYDVDKVGKVGDNGRYWSSTASAGNAAYYVYFENYHVPDASGDRDSGYSVRLITECQ